MQELWHSSAHISERKLSEEDSIITKLLTQTPGEENSPGYLFNFGGKVMHRKKKIPVSFIVAFVLSFMVSTSLAVVLPILVPEIARFSGLILFCGGLILCFLAVAIIGVIKRKGNQRR